MADARNRQLPLLIATLLGMQIAGAQAADADHSTPAQELQAARLLETALGLRESRTEEWIKLGAIYADLVRKYPRDAPVRSAYGDYLWTMQDLPGAMREWRVAAELEPRNASVLTQLAGGSLALGRARDSLGYYLQASEAAPTNAATHFQIANVAFLFRHELGRSEAEAFTLALTHFAEAHRLAPKNADFARGYAETFYAIPQPDWTTALTVWEDFLAITEAKDFALVNLARVRLKLGHFEEARACLAQVRSPEFDRLKARLHARVDAEAAGAVRVAP